MKGLTVKGERIDGLKVKGLTVKGERIDGLKVKGLTVLTTTKNGSFDRWFVL